MTSPLHLLQYRVQEEQGQSEDFKPDQEINLVKTMIPKNSTGLPWLQLT